MNNKKYLTACAAIAFFPWVSFGLNNFDTQPWFLIAAFPFLLSALAKPGKGEIPIILFISIVAIFLSFEATRDPAHSARGIGTYISFSLSLLFFNRYIKLQQDRRIKILAITNFFWLAYAVFQVLGIDNYIPIVSGRTSETRGYTSLAAEPTFYGIFSLFQMLISSQEQRIYRSRLHASNNILTFVWWLNFISIIAIARSSMVIILLLIIAAFYLLFFRPRFFVCSLIITAVLLKTINFLPEPPQGSTSRPLILTSKFLSDPTNIVILDQSINERVSAIYISIKSSFSDIFIPHGLYSFEATSQRYYNNTNWIMTPFGNKVMSFIGGLLFEVGFISFLVFYYITRNILLPLRWDHAAFWAITLFFIFATTVPLGFPLTGYLLAVISEARKIESPARARHCNKG